MLKTLGVNCSISLPHQLLLLNSVELLHTYRRLRETERDQHLQKAYNFVLHVINTGGISLKPFYKL